MSGNTVNRDELVKYLEQLLDINRFRDYSPNGLQVEGRREIGFIVSGVTASLALIDAAIAAGADTLLVHHGYFWRGEDPCVVGPRQRRLKRLLAQDINLLAYHLPLDAHPILGNNAQLARRLGLEGSACFGEDHLGWLGRSLAPQHQSVGDLAAHIEQQLGRKPLLIGDPAQPLGRIGWCTGAAQNMLGAAIQAGAQTFLSGEISEPTVHLALETGVSYLACGHHATERGGVDALGTHLADQFGVRHRFIDIPHAV